MADQQASRLLITPYILFCFVVMDAMWYVNLVGITAILELFSQDFSVDIQFAQAVVIMPFFFGTVLGQCILGSLSDRFGRVPVFFVTLNLYAISSLLCFFTLQPSWLIFFRFTSGLAGSVGLVTVRAIINDHFTLQEGARFLSRVGAWTRLLAGLSPFVFYAMVQSYGWRSFFVVNAIFCSMVSAFSFYMLNDVRHYPDQQALSWETIKANLAHTLFYRNYVLALIFFMLVTVVNQVVLFVMPVFMDKIFHRSDLIHIIFGINMSAMGFLSLQLNRWLLCFCSIDFLLGCCLLLFGVLAFIWVAVSYLVVDPSILLLPFLVLFSLLYASCVVAVTNAFALSTQSLRTGTKSGGFVTSLTLSLSTLCHAVTGSLLAMMPLHDVVWSSLCFLLIILLFFVSYLTFFRPVLRQVAIHSAQSAH